MVLGKVIAIHVELDHQSTIEAPVPNGPQKLGCSKILEIGRDREEHHKRMNRWSVDG